MKSAVNGGSSNTHRILLVDDSQDILSVTDAILSSVGYEVITSMDGAIALQIMNLMTPDLVILDITMPRMDGYEVTRHIRHNTEWDRIPILLFSALSPSEVARGLEYGANDILSKPVSMDDLLGKVSLLLLNHQYYQHWQAS
jgi:two-component system, sensor histidine kinase and response regulator